MPSKNRIKEPTATAQDQTTSLNSTAFAFVHGIESFAQAALLGNRDDEATPFRHARSV